MRHRRFVCYALDGALGLALSHAISTDDAELAAVCQRLEHLLDHEARHFLKVPEGVLPTGA